MTFTLATYDGYECLPVRGLPALTEQQARRVLARGRREALACGWQVDGDGLAFTARRGSECVTLAVAEADVQWDWEMQSA